MNETNREIENEKPGWRFLTKNDPAEDSQTKKRYWFFMAELFAGVVKMLTS